MPRMGFPSLRVWGGPTPFFQSQRLKVGGSAARWVFVVTTILDGFQMCCLVKIAHYANEPRQESVARQVPLWDIEAPMALAADSGRMTGNVRKRLAGQEIATVVVNSTAITPENCW